MSERPGTTTDVLLALTGMALVLSILDTTFASRGYAITAAMPLLLFALLALWLRQHAQGGWIFWIVAIVLYAPLGGLVALHDPGVLLLPSFDTMGQVLGGTITAPGVLASTLPPVDPTERVLLVPYAIAYIAGAGTLWTALGTRRAVLPLIPLFLGLAATILVGAAEPAMLVPRGVVLASVGLWWASVRHRRNLEVVGGDRGGISQPLIAAVVVALVAGLVVATVPAPDPEDRVLLRGRTSNPAELSDASNPMTPRRDESRRPLLLTQGVPKGWPVRFAALDSYDDSGWAPGETSPGSGGAGFQQIGHEITPLHEGRETRVDVAILPAYSSTWLPILGELTSLELDYVDGGTELEDVRYNPSSTTVFVPEGVDPRSRYNFTAVLTPRDLAPDMATAKASAAQRQPRGEFLDLFLRPWRQQKGKAPLEQVWSFTDYLRTQGRLRVTGDSPVDPWTLRNLMSRRRLVATPHQYAALVALAAARLGVPARLAVGAVPDRQGRVWNADIASWVEIQVEDGTWRTLNSQQYLGTGLDESTTPDERRPQEQGQEQPADDPSDPARAERQQPDREQSAQEAQDSEQRVLWLLGIGLALVLLLLLSPALKLVRRARRHRASPWTSTYVGGWQEIVDAARDGGRPVPERLGRVAQAHRLEEGLDLARAADVAVFAPEAPDPADRRAYWSQTQEARRAILTALPWWRRVLAWLSPASLVSGWERRRRR